MVAVDYVETGSERDPDLLNRLKDFAVPLALSDSNPKLLRTFGGLKSAGGSIVPTRWPSLSRYSRIVSLYSSLSSTVPRSRPL